jgi:uncharacterized Zn-binding protein involved in type VI secretion
MPAVCRIGVDKAGGTILSSSNGTVLVNGIPASVMGSKVAGHGKGSHSSPTMVTGSPNVFIQGVPVVRNGDSASCGHTAGPGSPNVNANG